MIANSKHMRQLFAQAIVRSRKHLKGAPVYIYDTVGGRVNSGEKPEGQSFYELKSGKITWVEVFGQEEERMPLFTFRELARKSAWLRGYLKEEGVSL